MNISFNYDYKHVIWPSLTAGPFTVMFTTTSTDACLEKYEVLLCSYCSNSYSHFKVADEDNLHLIPRWRFLDNNFNIVSSIPINNMVQGPGGLTGSAIFYYVDDMPTVPSPVYLTAEISNICEPLKCCNVNKGELESKVIDTIPLWINEWYPKMIKYTTDGINNFSTKWATFPFKWYATLHDIIDGIPGPIIFSYCNSNKHNCETSLLSTTVKIIPNQIPYGICNDHIKINAFDKKGNYGWINGTVAITGISLNDTVNAHITGNINIDLSANNNLPVANNFMYISNSATGDIFKLNMVPSIDDSIEFFKQPNICYNFDLLDNTGVTYNSSKYQISTSGMHCFAVCDNYTWIGNKSSNIIYKVDILGNVIQTINLKHVNGNTITHTPLTTGLSVDVSSKTFLYNIATNISPDPLSAECICFNFYASATQILMDKLSTLDININDNVYSWQTIDSFNKTIELPNNTTTVNISISGNLLSEHDCHILSNTPIINLINYQLSDIHYCNNISLTDIAVNGNHNLFVLIQDGTKPYVYKFDKDGTFLGNIIDFGPAVPHTGVAIDCTIYNHIVVLTTLFADTYTEDGYQLKGNAGPPRVNILADITENKFWLFYNNQIQYNRVTPGPPGSPPYPIYTVEDLNNIKYVAIDNDGNPWFTCDSDDVRCLIRDGSSMFSLSSIFDDIPWEGHEIGGIGCSIYNDLWVLDSTDGKCYVIDLNLLNTSSQKIDEFSIALNQPIQVQNDWTGNKWYQKYSRSNNSTQQYNITGASNIFNIRPFELPFELRRFNESRDISKDMRSFAMAPHMNIKYNLWENFFGNAVGLTIPGQQLGRKVYDRIANFPMYHIDIDDCNVKQLYSIAAYLDVPIDDYNLSYPPELLRLIDIGSVKHNRIWGEIVKCNLNITQNKICPRCGYRHSNLGDKIEDPFTYTVTAGMSFIKHDRTVISPDGWTLEYPPMFINSLWKKVVLNGINGYKPHDISASSNGKYILVCNYNQEFAAFPNYYMSNDYGKTWMFVDIGDIVGFKYVSFVNVSQSGKYMTISCHSKRIKYSDDYGVTWSTIQIPVQGSQVLTHVRINDTGDMLAYGTQPGYSYSYIYYKAHDDENWPVYGRLVYDNAIDPTFTYIAYVRSSTKLTIYNFRTGQAYDRDVLPPHDPWYHTVKIVGITNEKTVYVLDKSQSKLYYIAYNDTMLKEIILPPELIGIIDNIKINGSGETILITTNSDEIWNSYNNGKTWSKFVPSIPFTHNTDNVYINDSGDVQLVYGDLNTLFRKTGKLEQLIAQNKYMDSLCYKDKSTFEYVSVYPLVNLSSYDLDFCGPYDFYEYKDGFPTVDDCDPLNPNYVQGAGYINWNDEWTTLDWWPNSALNLWYGNNELYQTAIEYELLRGLQLNSNTCKVIN